MSNLEENGYLKVPDLIDAQTIGTISQYFENKIKRGEWVPKERADALESSKFGYYSDPLIEVLLKTCGPEIEQHTGLSLHPSYSFSRVYQEGEALHPHTDRPSCEISVTINVGCTGDSPWPIWMDYKDKDPAKILLSPGDAVIYKGCEVTHWRKPLPPGEINVQFMLHYVIKDGPNALYKLDGRSSLGLNRL